MAKAVHSYTQCWQCVVSSGGYGNSFMVEGDKALRSAKKIDSFQAPSPSTHVRPSTPRGIPILRHALPNALQTKKLYYLLWRAQKEAGNREELKFRIGRAIVGPLRRECMHSARLDLSRIRDRFIVGLPVAGAECPEVLHRSGHNVLPELEGKPGCQAPDGHIDKHCRR